MEQPHRRPCSGFTPARSELSRAGFSWRVVVGLSWFGRTSLLRCHLEQRIVPIGRRGKGMGLSVNGAGGPLFAVAGLVHRPERLSPPVILLRRSFHRCGASEIHSQGIAVHTAHRNVAGAPLPSPSAMSRGVWHELPPADPGEELFCVAERGGPRRTEALPSRSGSARVCRCRSARRCHSRRVRFLLGRHLREQPNRIAQPKNGLPVDGEMTTRRGDAEIGGLVAVVTASAARAVAITHRAFEETAVYTFRFPFGLGGNGFER